MIINWTALFTVVVVSFSSTIAVVVLMAMATLGLSARRAPLTPLRALTRPARPQHHRGLYSRQAGTAVAMACLAVTAAIVLVALYQIVAP